MKGIGGSRGTDGCDINAVCIYEILKIVLKIDILYNAF